MLKIKLKYCAILFVSGMLASCSVPVRDSLPDEVYLKGISALKNKDTVSAEQFFKESISKNADAASYYELAKICINKNTIYSRISALENLRNAVFIEPDNIEYRLAFAKEMRGFARVSSMEEFKKVIAIDSTNFSAWLNLAEIKDEDFTEYNNSVRKMSDQFYGSLQEFANEDFLEAEKYYLNALKYDSTNYDANLKSALLYEKAEEFEKGIPFLKRLEAFKKDDKDVHLCMGLVYYKLKKMKECYEEYKKALTMMSGEEYNDFTFNSVKFLIKPAFKNVVESESDYELKQFIELYWKVLDPLYLTDYNERLLEHYSRVAYANLFLGVKKMGKIGWKTNRGEVVLRYGEPLNMMRIRPSMDEGNSNLNVKTEVWNYKDMTLGFTDMAMSGNYLFSEPAGVGNKMISQFTGDTQFMMDNLRRLRYFYYDPKFEGPTLEVPYSISQFKSFEKRNHTDVYVNYILTNPDSLYSKTRESVNYQAGLFFLDRNYEEQFRKISGVATKQSEGKQIIKSLTEAAISDSGLTSFEILREFDKGAAASRKDLRIKKFSNNMIDISDILLAYNISKEKTNGALINRNNIYILPNPTSEFKKDENLFLYYELYNMPKGPKGLTDFEQRITIKKYEEPSENDIENAAKAVLNFLGIGRNEAVTLTSNYQTLETDPQIYLQLDLSKYQPGKYSVEITVKDKLTAHEISSKAIINWDD